MLSCRKGENENIYSYFLYPCFKNWSDTLEVNKINLLLGKIGKIGRDERKVTYCIQRFNILVFKP